MKNVTKVCHLTISKCQNSFAARYQQQQIYTHTCKYLENHEEIYVKYIKFVLYMIFLTHV